MATRTILIALVSAAVVVGGAGCGTSSTSGATTSSRPIPTTSTSAAASPAPACADIGGTVEADQTCRVYSETPDYTLDSSSPSTIPTSRRYATT